jgi:hypothetical protein
MQLRIRSGADTSDIARMGVIATHARKLARYAAQTRSPSFTLSLDRNEYSVTVTDRAVIKPVATVKRKSPSVGTDSLGTSAKKIMAALDSGKAAYRNLTSEQQSIARSERSKRSARTAAANRGW